LPALVGHGQIDRGGRFLGDEQAALAGLRRLDGAHRRRQGALGNGAEVLGGQLFHLLGLHIANHHGHCIVGRVVGAEVVLEIRLGPRLDVGLMADHRQE
jgi:hypothetical protein